MYRVFIECFPSGLQVLSHLSLAQPHLPHRRCSTRSRNPDMICSHSPASQRGWHTHNQFTFRVRGFVTWMRTKCYGNSKGELILTREQRGITEASETWLMSRNVTDHEWRERAFLGPARAQAQIVKVYLIHKECFCLVWLQCWVPRVETEGGTIVTWEGEKLDLKYDGLWIPGSSLELFTVGNGLF